MLSVHKPLKAYLAGFAIEQAKVSIHRNGGIVSSCGYAGEASDAAEVSGEEERGGSSSGEGDFRPGTPQQPSVWRLPRSRAARAATTLLGKECGRSVGIIGDPQPIAAAGEGDAETVAGTANVCSTSGLPEHGSEQMPAAIAAGDASAWCIAAATSAPPLDPQSNDVSRWSGESVCVNAKDSDVSSSSSSSDWGVQQSSDPVTEQLGITGLSESSTCALGHKGVAQKGSGVFVVNVCASSSVHEPLAPSAASLLGAYAFDLSSMKSEDNDV